jgi:post-segregation antitoxin (ccd killing protein)
MPSVLDHDGMVRMQIQFTDEQQAELRYQARKRGVSISAVVREAVDRELMQHPRADDAWERMLAAVGSFRGDGANVSEYHDDYLADAYAED